MPGSIDLELIDKVLTIPDKAAFGMARELARKEAWMVGSSAGAVVAGALEAARELDENAVMVMLLPDSGKNYLSTVFNDAWLETNGLM